MADQDRPTMPEWLRPLVTHKTRFALLFGAGFAISLAVSSPRDPASLGGALLGGALFIAVWLAVIHLIARRYTARDRS